MKPSDLKVGQRIKATLALDDVTHIFEGAVTKIELSSAIIGKNILLADEYKNWEITILSEPEDPLGTIRGTDDGYHLYILESPNNWSAFDRQTLMTISTADIKGLGPAINQGKQLKIIGKLNM